MTNNFELSNNERLVMDVLGRENSPKSAYMILDELRGLASARRCRFIVRWKS